MTAEIDLNTLLYRRHWMKDEEGIASVAFTCKNCHPSTNDVGIEKLLNNKHVEKGVCRSLPSLKHHFQNFHRVDYENHFNACATGTRRRRTIKKKSAIAV